MCQRSIVCSVVLSPLCPLSHTPSLLLSAVPVTVPSAKRLSNTLSGPPEVDPSGAVEFNPMLWTDDDMWVTAGGGAGPSSHRQAPSSEHRRRGDDSDQGRRHRPRRQPSDAPSPDVPSRATDAGAARAPPPPPPPQSAPPPPRYSAPPLPPSSTAAASGAYAPPVGPSTPSLLPSTLPQRGFASALASSSYGYGSRGAASAAAGGSDPVAVLPGRGGGRGGGGELPSALPVAAAVAHSVAQQPPSPSIATIPDTKGPLTEVSARTRHIGACAS